LAKGDIALLSYSPGGSSRSTLHRLSWWVHLGPHVGDGGVIGSRGWYHSKRRWWLPIGHSLWPML